MSDENLNSEDSLRHWKQRIHADRIQISGHEFENVEVAGEYDERYEFLLTLRVNEISGLLSKPDTNDIMFVSGKSTPILTLRRQLMIGENRTEYVFIPFRSPEVILETSKPMLLRSKVLNGPTLFLSGTKLSFNVGNFSITYIEDEVHREKYRETYQLKRFAESGYLEAFRNDREKFTFEEAFHALRDVQHFLSFLSGDFVSIGHLEGLDSRGKQVLFAPGFNKKVPLPTHTNWYGVSQVKELPKLVEKFLETMKIEEVREVILRTLDFYKSSTSIRSVSIEMAIVASSAALEVIVPEILKKCAWMDRNLLSDRIPFHSKLRSCFGVVGLEVDPLSGLEKLKKKSGSLNNADAFEMSVLFRNRIVHQGKQFSVSGEELHEVWNLQMWMIEILIFFLIGYSGSMHDRRPTSGWSGGAVAVPLS